MTEATTLVNDNDGNKATTQFVVGEHTVYNSVEDLYEGAKQKEAFIQKLVEDLKEANTKIEELSKNSTIADQLKQIREHTENTTTPVSEEAIKQIALNAMQEEKRISQAESNLANCKQAVASINSDVDLALKNKAQELGCTVEYLENLAKTSPKAFKTMFGIKEQVSFADVNYLQSTRHVNTETANNEAQEFFKNNAKKADINQVTAFMKKAMEHPEILANVKW